VRFVNASASTATGTWGDAPRSTFQCERRSWTATLFIRPWASTSACHIARASRLTTRERVGGAKAVPARRARAGPPLFAEALRAAKKAVGPQGLLNPGVSH
jgi:hypothetical protein